MADSILGYVPLPPLTDNQYRAYGFPCDVRTGEKRRKGRIERKGERLDWITVRSIAGTEFKIAGKAQLLGDGYSDKERVGGYWVSFNGPTNSVGNNILLMNSVPKVCQLAVLHLQRWALQEGCSWEGVKLLNYERMKLHEVTPTFLHEFSTRDEAVSISRDVRLAMELHNGRGNGDKPRAERAFGVGPSYEGTGYLKTRDIDLAGYVKCRNMETSHWFESDEVRLAIYDKGECRFRLESLLKGAFLSRTGLDHPEAWRLYGGDGPYPMIYARIRELLFLHVNLRSDEPSVEEVERLLNPNDAEVARWHLSGRDAKQHPAVVADRDRLGQQKYFSDLKRRVLTRLRIDLSIRWDRQCAAQWERLRKALMYPGMYWPPVELRDDVFCPQSVDRLVLELETDIARLAPRRLSTMVLDPICQEPPLVSTSSLRVSTSARRLLDIRKIPLHGLLRCHTLGSFGDMSLDEVAHQRAALRAGGCVASHFLIGNGKICISTDQRTGLTCVESI